MFFFLFGEMNHAERGISVLIVNMVLTIGILGTGLFGAGIRATMDRETNILRRFKVAPISPAPLMVASMVVGVLNYIPVYALILVLANRMYGMPVPRNLVSLTVFVLIGVMAFRAIGSMVASVANSAQEAQILVQLLYMPMLFLSGATIPLSIMPQWVQTVGQYLPATHLFTGMQSIMGQGESDRSEPDRDGGTAADHRGGDVHRHQAVPLGEERETAAGREVVGSGGARAVRADGGVPVLQQGEPGPQQGLRSAVEPEHDLPGAQRAHLHGRWGGDRKRIGTGQRRKDCRDLYRRVSFGQRPESRRDRRGRQDDAARIDRCPRPPGRAGRLL